MFMLLNTIQFVPPSIPEPRAVNLGLDPGGCAGGSRVMQNPLNPSSVLGCCCVWEQNLQTFLLTWISNCLQKLTCSQFKPFL